MTEFEAETQVKTFNEEPSPNAIFKSKNYYPSFGPDSKKSLKKWTREEDELLIKLAEISKGKKWKWIASQIPGKRDSQCRSRWERIRPGMKQGRWTPEEDEHLRKLYSIYGDKWSELAKNLNNRTGKQVRDRIKNVLDARLDKNCFTLEDDEKIYKLYQERGPKWKQIQQEFFPDRTADFIKNRFYSHYRKFKQKFSIKTHENTVASDSVNHKEKLNSDVSKKRDFEKDSLNNHNCKQEIILNKNDNQSERPIYNQVNDTSQKSIYIFKLDNQNDYSIHDLHKIQMKYFLNQYINKLVWEQKVSLLYQRMLQGTINNFNNCNFNWFN